MALTKTQRAQHLTTLRGAEGGRDITLENVSSACTDHLLVTSGGVAVQSGVYSKETFRGKCVAP